MNTKWLGLWTQEKEGVCAGQVIKKSEIPAYTRIVMMPNKYYKEGTNRPKFVYCFADSIGYEDKCKKIDFEEDPEYLEELERLQERDDKIEELADVMREGQLNSWNMCLPSESAGTANELRNRAIQLIEDITGEEWNFTYLNWG